MTKPYFSIIVPVYNRPDEAKELIQSLVEQSDMNFELVLIEDGSTLPCSDCVAVYQNKIKIVYELHDKIGRSPIRNYAMQLASGDYFLFFDSDCIIPPHYIEKLSLCLKENYSPCFGGPDKAHHSFNRLQKAISYSMTSFFTTGGIRGGNQVMEKFTPRTFNMGFSREVWENVGGFNEMIGEDQDISNRIRKAGFETTLYSDLFVYHKRRVSLRSFFKQVFQFGGARIALFRLHPHSLKVVHLLPAAFTIGTLTMIVLAFITPYALLPLGLYYTAIFIDSLWQNKDLRIALLSIITSTIQLGGYGLGFLTALFTPAKKID